MIRDLSRAWPMTSDTQDAIARHLLDTAPELAVVYVASLRTTKRQNFWLRHAAELAGRAEGIPPHPLALLYAIQRFEKLKLPRIRARDRQGLAPLELSDAESALLLAWRAKGRFPGRSQIYDLIPIPPKKSGKSTD